MCVVNVYHQTFVTPFNSYAEISQKHSIKIILDCRESVYKSSDDVHFALGNKQIPWMEITKKK